MTKTEEVSWWLVAQKRLNIDLPQMAVADPAGGSKGAMPPTLYKIGQKDGCRRRRLISHVSCPPLSHVSGSATFEMDIILSHG